MNNATERFTVDSIRPDSLEALRKEASRIDGEWLVEKRPFFEVGHCPLCGEAAPAAKLYALENGLAYNICYTCSTLFLEHRPTSEMYEEFYRVSAGIQLFSTHIFPQSYHVRVEKIYRPRLQRMLEYYGRYNKGGSFVEIGAGSGVFAGLVKDSKQFTSVTAVEPAPGLADSCRKNGLTVIELPVEKIEAEAFSGVSLVSCFEVLEHLVNPGEFVRSIYSLLPEGGFFCLTTPNGRGFDVLELKEKSTTLGLTHVNLFNPGSLHCLLEQAGFTVLEVTTPGILDVDLVCRGYAEQHAETQDSSSWLRHFLQTGTESMKLALQDFLVAQKQSSHMWAICQK